MKKPNKEQLERDFEDMRKSLELLEKQFKLAKSEKDIFKALSAVRFYGEQAQNLLNEYKVRVI